MSTRIKVVAAIIQDKKGCVLAARKKQGKPSAGLWEFPGGKVEKDEESIKALEREIKEELGIQITFPQFFHAVTHFNEDIELFLESYLCHYIPSEIILSDHDVVCWANAAKLSELNFAEADFPIVEKLLTQPEIFTPANS